MQEPRGTQAVRQGLGFAESMVRTFEQNAKFYWRMWGPLGQPMIQATEQWANVQRSYIRSLREDPGRIAPVAPGDAKVAERSTGAAEGSTAESEEGPGEEIRNAVKESVSRSEEGSGREPQAGAITAPEESQGDTEGLPIEEYDSLNVSQVTQRLGELSVEELERLRDYEAENRSRRSLLERFERRIRVAR
jgi:hypothetical protein